MKTLNTEEILNRIIGPISPIGETNEDEKRLENLNQYIELFDAMFLEICKVSENSTRDEYSMQIVGLEARKCMITTMEYLNDIIE